MIKDRIPARCQPTRRHFVRLLAANSMLLPSVGGWMAAQPSSADQPTYRRGGFSSMTMLGKALFKALKPQYRDQIHFLPVSLETEVMPYIRLEEYKDPDMPKPMRMVFVSVGFIDLVNNLAHAKAVDRIERGFFEKYIISLARETGEKQLEKIPRINDPKLWTEDLMNEQESNFSQMVGIILATEISHHYLGHLQKYGDKLTDANGKPLSINQFLTEPEWQASVKAGTLNSLNAGYAIEGVHAFYDAIDRMQQRPPWIIHFLPPFVKISKLKKYQKLLEDNFFANREQ